MLAKALQPTVAKICLTLVLSVAMAVLFFHVISQPFQVSGSSMNPTLSDRDYLLVDKFFLRGKDLRIGDLVIFQTEKDARYLVKRVAASEGDVVSIRDGKLCVNGQESPFTRDARDVLEGHGERWTVPPGHFFLLGDNLELSKDSRSFGPVPLDRVVGRVIFRYLPLKEARWFLEEPDSGPRPEERAGERSPS